MTAGGAGMESAGRGGQSPPPALRFQPLGTASPEERAAFFALYHKALPASERKPDTALLAMAQRADCVVELALLGAVAVGFLVLYRAQAQPIALLDYLGVDASARSGGLGTALFARAAALAEGRTLLIEVESDGDIHAPDLAERRRRKRFYARQGCRQIAGLAYRMPAQGTGTPPPMDLLALTAHDLVPRETLRAWINDIHVHAYGQPSDHPLIAHMMACLPERLALEPIQTG